LEADQTLNIIFIVRNAWYYRHFDRVVRILCNRGHRVRVLVVNESKKTLYGRVLQECHDKVVGCQVEYLPPHNRRRLRLLSQFEELINYAHYFKPQWPSSAVVARWEKKFLPGYFPRYFQVAIKKPKVKSLLLGSRVQTLLKRFVTSLRPDPKILDWLQHYRPDIVIASPYVFTSYLEVEYVRAAQHMGIPTMVALASWDNLTTKGTIQLMPDAMTVWNEPLLKEAVEIHNVPNERIIVTGSPSFDRWFGQKPSVGRDEYCGLLGIDPNLPYVLYLCSSSSMAGDETGFVNNFLNALRKNPDTQHVTVVIRPHPTNAQIWSGFSAENACIWPIGGDFLDVPEAQQDYFNMLYYGLAVVGVNTSAFLEATIVDKPCITIMTDHYRDTQGESYFHFRHLMNGDFLEIADSFSESAEIISKILSGIDSGASNRSTFVKDFIRPRGYDKSASQVLADVIETIAKSARNISI